MPGRTEPDAAEWLFGHPRAAAIWAIVLAFLAAVVLAGCGGEEPPKPATVPKISDLTREASLDYKKDDTGREIKEISVPVGSIVYIMITSDVFGAVHLDEYDVTRRVTAGKKAALVVSADYPGVFDVSFDHKEERDPIARLNVGAK